MLNWLTLSSIEQLNSLIENSSMQPIVLFKHSTRCSISSMVLNRLNREKEIKDIHFYYLDLIKHRDVSNEIERLFNVLHQSPQILFIKNEKCIFHDSQGSIMLDDILEII